MPCSMSVRPEVARLIAAMVQARDAVEHRTWSHPQEPTGEEWWADVLADRRARKRERRTDLAVKQAFYRLADEKRETILVACSKCDCHLIASHGADYAMPNLLNHLAAPSCRRLGSHWDRLRRALRRADRGCAVARQYHEGCANAGGNVLDVDARVRAPRGPHADVRLPGDARGRDGAVREVWRREV